MFVPLSATIVERLPDASPQKHHRQVHPCCVSVSVGLNKLADGDFRVCHFPMVLYLESDYDSRSQQTGYVRHGRNANVRRES